MAQLGIKILSTFDRPTYFSIILPTQTPVSNYIICKYGLHSSPLVCHPKKMYQCWRVLGYQNNRRNNKIILNDYAITLDSLFLGFLNPFWFDILLYVVIAAQFQVLAHLAIQCWNIIPPI